MPYSLSKYAPLTQGAMQNSPNRVLGTLYLFLRGVFPHHGSECLCLHRTNGMYAETLR